MENTQQVNPQNTNQNNQPSKGFGIASLILGILSIPLSFIVYIGPVLAILGIIFEILQNKKSKTKLATAGLILSIIGIILTIIIFVAGIIFLRSFTN